MNPADLELPEDVDALKALLVSARAETAAIQARNLALEQESTSLTRARSVLEAEIAALQGINAAADERIARLTSIIKMFERARYGKRSEKLRIDPLEDEQYGKRVARPTFRRV